VWVKIRWSKSLVINQCRLSLCFPRPKPVGAGPAGPVTRHHVSCEIPTSKFRAARPCGTVPGSCSFLGLGVHSNAPRHRTLVAARPRQDGPTRGHPAGDRSATRPAYQHRPRPDTTCLTGRLQRPTSGGSRAPLSHLRSSPRPGPPTPGGGPRSPSPASPLGGRSHPDRVDSDRPGGCGPLGPDPPALVASARPGPGPSRPTPGRIPASGRAPAWGLAGGCRRSEAPGHREDDLLAAGGR
jgi:hypothetical protein